jgi:hypothetical protein
MPAEPPCPDSVLESWGFADELCDAVGEQMDHERRWRHAAGLSDVLIVSLVLEEARQQA